MGVVELWSDESRLSYELRLVMMSISAGACRARRLPVTDSR